MAGPITCDSCGTELAELMIGNLRTGDQLAVCGACLLPWTIAQLDSRVPQEARGQLADYFRPAPEPVTERTEPPPARKRPQPSAAAPEPESEPQLEPEPEEPSTAQDG